jgi:hypothetical protein
MGSWPVQGASGREPVPNPVLASAFVASRSALRICLSRIRLASAKPGPGRKLALGCRDTARSQSKCFLYRRHKRQNSRCIAAPSRCQNVKEWSSRRDASRLISRQFGSKTDRRVLRRDFGPGLLVSIGIRAAAFNHLNRHGNGSPPQSDPYRSVPHCNVAGRSLAWRRPATAVRNAPVRCSRTGRLSCR